LSLINEDLEAIDDCIDGEPHPLKSLFNMFKTQVDFTQYSHKEFTRLSNESMQKLKEFAVASNHKYGVLDIKKLLI